MVSRRSAPDEQVFAKALAEDRIVLTFDLDFGHLAALTREPDKALVQMSIRYRWDDIFCFSLFHELGHVLLHGRDSVFIEREDGDKEDEPEQDADRFASDHLIPPSVYAAFLRRPDYRTKAAVVAFAREQGIAPSLVVGRLQHDGHLPHSHLNDLRSRFECEKPSRTRAEPPLRRSGGASRRVGTAT